MERPGILTLTTDFGTEGPYVAAMKGVVLGLAPRATLVDISHAVAPQNILEGAFVLAEVIDAFPAGTVHLAVVDPGVGTRRRLVAVQVDAQWFVLPDNGLITGVLRRRQFQGVWEISNPAIRRAHVSDTFHGRDILAPAAAHLLNGGQPDDLGPRREKLVTLRNFVPSPDTNGYVGEIIFRDAFGNLISNISRELLAGHDASGWVVEVAGHRIEGLDRTYGDRAPGSIVALAGSSGWIEVAVVNGDAARQLSTGPGATIRVRRNT
ncbi:MAG: SAM-dependent chlorinase/fluorinase [Isosphaeraceae bacterium]